MKTKITALFTAALVAVISFAADESKPTGKDPMSAYLSGMSGDQFEAAFLAMMVHHHRDAVELAKVVQEKFKNAELKRIAAQMTKDQEEEIQQMTGWLKQWHGKAPYDYDLPDESVKMILQDTLRLQKAEGDEFDKAFCDVMARHHAGAIEMARQAIEKAPHKEVKQLAQKIDKMQSEERQQLLNMQEILTSDGNASPPQQVWRSAPQAQHRHPLFARWRLSLRIASA